MMKNEQNICSICGGTTANFIEQIWDDRYGFKGVFSILKCDACGHMVTTPPFLESQLPDLYSKYYPRDTVDFESLEYESSFVKHKFAHLKRWFAGIDNQGHYLAKEGQSVLDIGCGSCLSLLELSNLGIDGYGVETDPNVHRIAQRYNLNVHIGSIHDTPFAEKTFDLITLNQVIEHMPDPAALLSVVRNRLSNNGLVTLSCPNTSSLFRRISGKKWINWHVPYHLHHFNRTSLCLLAQQQGYEVVSIRTVTPNVWTQLQLRALGKSPKEGVASVQWQGNSMTQSEQASIFHRMKNAMLRIVARVISVGFALINRVVDYFGAGDSLLVVLKKQK